jgi:uncharacterized membrane protein YhhN
VGAASAPASLERVQWRAGNRELFGILMPMLNVIITLVAAILLAGLLYFEKATHLKWKLPTKTILSCLFILTALVQSHPIPGYFYILLIGLIFCLGGDVFLALPRERMFLFGLVSFLLGHVFYVGCFFYLVDVSHWTWIGAGIGLVAGGAVFFRLRPHLGSMLIPVMAYIVVITVMLVGAWTVLGDSGVDFLGRLLVFSGAVSFYVSDLFVARDRFLKMEFKNRLFGLPLYYFGQFLLAFSVGVVN